MPPNQYNMSHNNHFYANGANLGYNNVHGIGNSGYNNGGYGTNYSNVNNMFGYNNNTNMNNMNNNRVINNNLNNGMLTANDIYMKKDENVYNMNFGQYNGNVRGNFNNDNSNLNNLTEIKLKKTEDPFSNLISFK